MPVHYLHNAFALPSTEELAQLLKSGLRDAWAAPDRQQAQVRIARLTDSVRERNGRIAELLEETVEATLCFYALKVPTHGRRLPTTNSVEHDNGELRRRTSVIRVFPNEESLVRLTTSLAIERNEQGFNARTYGWKLKRSTKAPKRSGKPREHYTGRETTENSAFDRAPMTGLQ